MVSHSYGHRSSQKEGSVEMGQSFFRGPRTSSSQVLELQKRLYGQQLQQRLALLAAEDGEDLSPVRLVSL